MKSPIYKLNPYVDDDGTVYINFWTCADGWKRDIKWSDFQEIDDRINIIEKLFVHFPAKYPIGFARVNTWLKDNVNIVYDDKRKAVRNMFSEFYKLKDINGTRLEDKADIVIYSNGLIDDEMDIIDCNVDCAILKLLYDLLGNAALPGFFENVKMLKKQLGK